MYLRWRGTTKLAVETDVLRPEVLQGMRAGEVARLTVRVGNQEGEVGDLFRVSEEGGKELVLEGDMRSVRNIGRGMSVGALVVRGRAGALLGAEMTGGSIEVDGDAGDDAGVAMRGGMIRVRGDAGDGLGGSFPGSRIGMRDGLILVHGSAGSEVGRRLRRGLIVVGGDVGDAAGRRMIAGSLLVFGGLGAYAGMGMKRGTIATFGAEVPELGGSFAASGRFRFPFLGLYLRQLRGWGFPVPDAVLSASVERYNGDVTERGRGEVLVLAGASGG